MKDSNSLVILGGGGFAREVLWLAKEINLTGKGSWEVVGFWTHGDEGKGESLHGKPIVGPEHLERYLPNLFAVAAIGKPAAREAFGCKFATLIHPDVLYDKDTLEIGAGTIICPGSIITVDTSIGMHVIINIDCTIGHDCVIEDFVTLSPGCHISGYNHVERGAYLGTGVVTIEKHRIGESSIIGAGSVVVRDIESGITAAGVPARKLSEK
jgi:sugar O-acyltransferase (sialic acid O-acetyltransferase NeuD family)